MLFRQPVRKLSQVVTCRARDAHQTAPTMAEYVVGGAAIVPYDFFVFFRNLRYRHCQAAGIRAQENVNLICSQKLEYVLPGKADLAAIVIPNQPDRPFLPVPHGNAALSIDVRLPEANTLERLLAQAAELAGQGNGQPDRNFCLVAHILTRGNLCVQVIVMVQRLQLQEVVNGGNLLFLQQIDCLGESGQNHIVSASGQVKNTVGLFTGNDHALFLELMP